MVDREEGKLEEEKRDGWDEKEEGEKSEEGVRKMKLIANRGMNERRERSRVKNSSMTVKEARMMKSRKEEEEEEEEEGRRKKERKNR